VLEGNKLVLKLGYLMQKQSFVPSSSFKAITNYDVNISFSQNISQNIDGIVEIK